MQLRGFGFVRTKNSSEISKNFFDENLSPISEGQKVHATPTPHDYKSPKKSMWPDSSHNWGSAQSYFPSLTDSTEWYNSLSIESIQPSSAVTSRTADSPPPPAIQTEDVRPPEPPPVASSSFGQDCISRHNQLRSSDNVPALQWDDNIAIFAQQWANKLAGAGVLEHSNIGFGENLYVTFGGDKSCKAAVDAWYSEKQFYRPGSPVGEGDFGSYGHYTQVFSKYVLIYNFS
jgi:uncharacterized protein YkwD